MGRNELKEVDAGYLFAPHGEGSTIGHPRLDVYIRAKPTLRHFDPQTIELPVRKSARKGLEETTKRTVHHPWSGAAHDQVTLGRIILSDRLGKKKEAFTFGGMMEVTSGPSCTQCTILSEAPILELFGGATLSDLLADEAEVLLADLKGEMYSRLADLDRGLALAQPEEIYQAILWELKDRFDAFQHRELHTYQELLNLLQREIETRRARGNWETRERSLEQVLLG